MIGQAVGLITIHATAFKQKKSGIMEYPAVAVSADHQCYQNSECMAVRSVSLKDQCSFKNAALVMLIKQWPLIDFT